MSGDFEFILEIMADETLATTFGDDAVRIVGETNYFKIYPVHPINGIEFLVTDCTVYDRSINMQFNIHVFELLRLGKNIGLKEYTSFFSPIKAYI